MERLFRFLGVIVIAGFLSACTADVEDSGSLPDVDVQGGEMPDVDVDPVDVDVSTDTQVVEVPDIDIEAQE